MVYDLSSSYLEGQPIILFKCIVTLDQSRNNGVKPCIVLSDAIGRLRQFFPGIEALGRGGVIYPPLLSS